MGSVSKIWSEISDLGRGSQVRESYLPGQALQQSHRAEASLCVPVLTSLFVLATACGVCLISIPSGVRGSSC